MKLQAETRTLDLTRIEAFIFDLDGTLVESEHVWAKAKAAVSARHGSTPTQAELDAFVGRSVADFVGEYLCLAQDPARSDAVDQITRGALRDLQAELREIPGASRLVKDAHDAGIRIAICSSAPPEAIRTSARFLGIGGLVETPVSAAGMIKGKPDKYPYEETLRKLCLEPQQAVAFEDSLSGVRSSTAAGIPTVYLGSSTSIEALPGVVASCASVDDIRFRL